MLCLWTVYAHPVDHPESFVVRQFRTFPDGTVLPLSNPHAVVSSLDEARESLPSGLVWLGRSQLDDPAIVESWI